MTKRVYEDHRQRGKALYLEGKFEKAIAEYQLALRVHRPAVDLDDINLVHCSLSACQAALGHYDEAIAEAEIAIAMKPASPKGFYRKAEALIGAKRYGEAKTVYEQCLQTLPAMDEETKAILNVKIISANLLISEAEEGLYFRQLIPGRDICLASTVSFFNPITKVIYEVARQMKNIVYVIGDRQSKRCIVVDPCWDVEGILKQVRKDGMELIGGVLTHNHFDHVGGKPPPPFDIYHINVPGIKKLLEKCPPEAEGAPAKTHVHEEDADVLQMETGLDPERIVTVKDGEVLKIGRQTIRFMHTPGHTPGSQCLMINERRLITGDTLFAGACGRTDLPGGSAEELWRSLHEILAKLPDDLAVYPGHSYNNRLMTTIGEEKRAGVLKPSFDKEQFLKFVGSTPHC